MNWPVLKSYNNDHLQRIALPLGGIGTGTVSLGGRGDLRDWEVVNRPAKGFLPAASRARGQTPFFAVRTQQKGGGDTNARALEGPLPVEVYEGDSGCRAPNHGLPRFRQCRFETAYPFGQVLLSDPDMPVDVRLQAFNPLIPANADDSGIPVAVLRFAVTNTTRSDVDLSIVGCIPNFIGDDGSKSACGPRQNQTEFRERDNLCGLFMQAGSDLPDNAAAWGTLALSTPAGEGVTHRTA